MFIDLDGTSDLTMRRLHGPGFDEVIARIDDSGVVDWYLSDKQGSVRVILDNSASVTNAITYDAFGEITSGVLDDRYGYAGYEWDSITSLYSLGNGTREYDPATGTFQQVDPSGLAPDVNTYRYVGNGPTNGTDPSGRTVFIPASDVEWWRSAGEGNIGFLPIRNGTYQVVLGPGGRNGPLHERIKAALLANGMSEGDVGLTLNALYEGGVGERNPAYSHVHDQFAAFDPGDQGNRRRSASITHPYNRRISQSDYWTPAGGVNNWNPPVAPSPPPPFLSPGQRNLIANLSIIASPSSFVADLIVESGRKHMYDRDIARRTGIEPPKFTQTIILDATTYSDAFVRGSLLGGPLSIYEQSRASGRDVVSSIHDVRNQLIISPVLRAIEVYQQQRQTGESRVSASVVTSLYGVASILGVVDVEQAWTGRDIRTGELLSPTERLTLGLIGSGQCILSGVAGWSAIESTATRFASYAPGPLRPSSRPVTPRPRNQDWWGGEFDGFDLPNSSRQPVAPATPSPLPKNPTIHPGQQDKHIPGRNNFEQAVKRGETPSELTHPNPQKLLDDFTGKGTLRGSAESGWRETVDFGQIIGSWRDPATGASLPTTRGTIMYKPDGQAHIVPSNPNPLK